MLTLKQWCGLCVRALSDSLVLSGDHAPPTHAAVSENCSDSAAAEARRAVAMLYHPVMRMKCTAQDDEAKLRTEFI
jgi:hypothetical protein